MSATDLTVVTGDIVGSSAFETSELNAIFSAIQSACDSAALWGGAPSSRFTRFRGDGWQCLLPDPQLALRTALFLRASIRALGRNRDSRVSFGIAPGKLPNSSLSLSETGGPAFELSGHGLDDISRSARFSINRTRGALSQETAVFALADEISRRWTPAQARVFLHALPPEAATQTTIAKALGVSQQMVAKHLKAGGEWALHQAMAVQES